MCFAESGPGGQHLDFATFTRMVDRYVHLEGSADVLQISGGEPTLHPDLVRMAAYACSKPIAAVMINTNGVRLAKDPRLVEALAGMRQKLEIYLQFDGFEAKDALALRGEKLLDIKLQALENLRQHDLRCTLVCTVEHNANLHQLGRIVQFGLERPWVRGVSFQLASYCGRHVDPVQPRTPGDHARRRESHRRPDRPLVGRGGLLPAAVRHPNCHMLAYLYRGGARPVPISRIIDVKKHLSLVANSVVYTPARRAGSRSNTWRGLAAVAAARKAAGRPMRRSRTSSSKRSKRN